MGLSIKAVLRTDKKPDKNGEHQIMIRTIYNRKIKYPHTFPFRISEKDWNKKSEKVKPSNRKSKLFNDLIAEVKDSIEDFCYSEITTSPGISPNKLNDKLSGRRKHTDFFKAAEKVIKKQSRNNAWKTTKNKKGALKKLALFCDNDLNVDSIDRLLLKDFIDWCLDEEELAPSTVNCYLIIFKTIYDELALDKVISDPDPYLFKKLKLNADHVKKKPLTIQDIKTLSNLNYSVDGVDNSEVLRANALNIFLFMFHAAGMRISDALLLKWNNIKDGGISYEMRKIRRSKHSKIEIPLTDGAKEIIDKYRTKVIDPNDFIFPYLKDYDLKTETKTSKSVDNEVTNINYFLNLLGDKHLDRKFTCHVARHSFSAIFEANSHGDIEMLQTLLNHSDRSTTEGYRTRTYLKEQLGMEAFNESMKEALGE